MTKDNAELIAHMRREHDRLIPRNFPDQGYDWRTPVTAMLNRVPELLDALEAAEAERDAALSTRTVSTLEDLDALPKWTVVLSDEIAYQRGYDYWDGLGGGWDSGQIDLPATVLFIPKATS